MIRVFTCLALAAAFACAADDRVKVDNDYVRILKVLDQPHNKSPMHRHEPNRVMVFLNAGDLDVTDESGHVEHQHWSTEQVSWSPGGPLHTSENVGTAPIGIVEIEVKKPAPANPAKRDPQLDPVAIDPVHNLLLFENDQVRVIRTWREPGATEMLHEHTGAGRVVVLLSDIDATVKNANGTAGGMKGAAGDVYWTAGPVKHAGTNAGTRKFDMILVEVK